MEIKKEIINAVIRHAREQAPVEVCGYLGKKGSVVDTIVRIKNSENSPTRYAFDPREQLLALKKAEQEKWEIVAVYHSHPKSPAYPSKEDIRLAYHGDINYLIVSLSEEPPGLGLYKIEDGIVHQQTITIID